MKDIDTIFAYHCNSCLKNIFFQQLWRTVLQPLVAIEEVSEEDSETAAEEEEVVVAAEVVVVAAEVVARRRRIGFP